MGVFCVHKPGFPMLGHICKTDFQHLSIGTFTMETLMFTELTYMHKALDTYF